MIVSDPFVWIQSLDFEELTPSVRQRAESHLLDTLSVAVAATRTRSARIMGTFVQTQFPGDSPLLFSSGRASPVGAALYGAAVIDSLDAHDGQVLTKGHVGAAVVPALFSPPDTACVSGRELLTRLVIGYEVATRAGLALHATAKEYHTSGAWNALGVAAVVGRHLGLDVGQLAHALGTAEFYGPRSQMMRCIANPSMVKDGSAWGALAGASAAYLASCGFTGAPAITVSGDSVADIWDDLGERWYILEQYVKLYPVCRWAHPAIEATRQMRDTMSTPVRTIEAIEVETFHEACCLDMFHPQSSEQAQYSLPWAVACALLTGTVGENDVSVSALEDGERHRLATLVRATECEDFNRRFPAERWARVRLRLEDGRVLESQPTQARGDFDRPLSEASLLEKYRGFVEPVLGPKRAESLREAVRNLETSNTCDRLVDLVSDIS